MNNSMIHILIAANCASLITALPISFEAEQKKYERVRQAYQNTEKMVSKTLESNRISKDNFHITIMAFKEEQRLEIWAGNPDEKMKKIKDYEICASSGKPGPKRKEGDWQVPEGFYHVERFNPVSSYHLALGINYPNASDKILAKSKKLGGQIMIHGACITIGCLPMTNEGIEEIYLYAVKARNSGQYRIPVYIFPAEPGKSEYKKLIEKNQSSHVAFWENLVDGYNVYKNTGRPLSFSVSPDGKYDFTKKTK